MRCPDSGTRTRVGTRPDVAMLASVQVPQGQPSLVRRQIEQLQQSAATGRLPPHLSGTPLRPRLTRARTNLDVVWRSLSENRDPLDPLGAKAGEGAAPRPRPRRGEGEGNAPGERRGGLCGVAAKVSRSVTHLHQAHLCDAKDGTNVATQSLRQPLRTIQGTSDAVKPPVKPLAAKASALVKQATTFVKPAATAAAVHAPDAVYQTIEEKDAKQTVHYDKPVSPPVPVDPSRRKRFAVDKPDGPEGHRAAKAHAAVASSAGAQPPAKPKPGPKPSIKGAAKPPPAPDGHRQGHRTLPRKLSTAALRVVEINLEGVPPSSQSSSPPSSSPPSSSSSSTLPLQKSARGGPLWRRFSSFNPVSRWDDWSNSSMLAVNVAAIMFVENVDDLQL